MIVKTIGQGINEGVESFASSIGFKDPKKGRIIIISGISIIIIGAIAYGIYKWRKKKNAENYNILDMQKELEQGTKYSGNTTLTDGEAILIAQNLLNAMDRVGTDENAIYKSLEQCKTKGDLLLVIQKFGIKPYGTSGLADSWIAKKSVSTLYNLNGWLRAELSTKELKPVIEIYDKFGVAL
jgi:hypothetical protein